MSFTSRLYRYTVTLPAGWTVTPAQSAWDGRSDASHDQPNVDAFLPPDGTASVWAFAGPFSLDLAGFTKNRIAATAR